MTKMCLWEVRQYGCGSRGVANDCNASLTEKLVGLHGEILKEEGCGGYSEVSGKVVWLEVMITCVYMCVHVCRWRTNC